MRRMGKTVARRLSAGDTRSDNSMEEAMTASPPPKTSGCLIYCRGLIGGGLWNETGRAWALISFLD